MNNDSKHEANKLVRVLSGKPLKYTIRLHRADGSVVEFQADDWPKITHNSEARSLWISHGGYESKPIMPYEPGMIILCEENPKP